MTDEATPLNAPNDHSLRNNVGVVIDMAIEEVAPNEQLLWDLSFVMIGSANGGLQCHPMLIFSKPSPVLGDPAFTLSMMIPDARMLCDHQHAISAVRSAMERMREMQAQVLSVRENGQGEGGLIVPPG